MKLFIFLLCILCTQCAASEIHHEQELQAALTDEVAADKSCPMFSCANHDCQSAVRIENTWDHGMSAILTIPVDEEVDGWYLKIEFDNPLGKFEVWKADIVAMSSDKRTIILKNKDSEREINSDVLSFRILLQKQSSSWDILDIQFQSSDCPKFIFEKTGGNTTSAPLPANATAAPTAPKKTCPSYKCKGADCLPNTCLRNNWPSGMGGRIRVPAMRCDVRGWSVKVEFDKKVNRLEVWNAKVVNKTQINFVMHNLPQSRRVLAGEELIIGFNAAKRGRKRNIIGIEFQALDCSSFCPKANTAPPQPQLICPKIKCTGKECDQFMIVDNNQRATMQGRFKIPTPCNIDGWNAEIKFSGNFRKIKIQGAEVLSKVFRNNMVKLRNLCDRSMLSSDEMIEIPFEVKRGKRKIEVAEISMTPRICTCMITKAPSTIASTERVSPAATRNTIGSTAPPTNPPIQSTAAPNASTAKPVTPSPPSPDGTTAAPNASTANPVPSSPPSSNGSTAAPGVSTVNTVPPSSSSPKESTAGPDVSTGNPEQPSTTSSKGSTSAPDASTGNPVSPLSSSAKGSTSGPVISTNNPATTSNSPDGSTGAPITSTDNPGENI